MTFKILKINELPKRIAIPDIHYSPRYLKLFQDYLGWEAFYAYYEVPAGTILVPYFKRPIPDTEYFDIIGPWYFGGPITTNKALMPEFLELLHEWCIKENIVSEFQRLHPLLQNHKLYLDTTVFYDREVVYVRLKKSRDLILEEYDYKTRKNIAKAQREGLKAHNLIIPESTKEFVRIYTESMNRKNTSKFYFFNEEFYKQLFENFKPILITISDEDEVICSSLEIGGGEYCYDYLRGTNPSYLDKRPNDLAVDTAIQEAKNAGYKYFIIGGGNTKNPEDGQFRFKKSFSATTAPFYLYKKVHNKDKYDELCQTKGIKIPAYEQADYFPEYAR